MLEIRLISKVEAEVMGWEEVVVVVEAAGVEVVVVVGLGVGAGVVVGPGFVEGLQ